jgi:dynein heavy chain, axonemal
MLESLKKIKECLEKFNVKIIERKNKPMSPEDYDQYLKAIFVNKLNIVKEQGTLINKQLKEVLDSVKADKKGPAWKNYNDYVNTIVIDGIATAIQTALNHLHEQIYCGQR